MSYSKSCGGKIFKLLSNDLDGREVSQLSHSSFRICFHTLHLSISGDEFFFFCVTFDYWLMFRYFFYSKTPIGVDETSLYLIVWWFDWIKHFKLYNSHDFHSKSAHSNQLFLPELLHFQKLHKCIRERERDTALSLCFGQMPFAINQKAHFRVSSGWEVTRMRLEKKWRIPKCIIKYVEAGRVRQVGWNLSWFMAELVRLVVGVGL